MRKYTNVTSQRKRTYHTRAWYQLCPRATANLKMQRIYVHNRVSLTLRPVVTLGLQQLRSYGTRKESTQRKPRPNRNPRLPLILTEEVSNLGGRGDVVRVKRGYGRNYLLPKGKAVYYTPDNITEYNATIQTEGETRTTVAKERIKNLLSRKVVTIRMKEGQSLYAAHISFTLRQQLQLHVPIDHVVLAQPIKSLGEKVVNIVANDKDLLPVNLEVVPAIKAVD